MGGLRKQPAGKVRVVVRTDALFHSGRNYPHGSELNMPEKAAKPLLKAGYVEKTK